MCAASARKSPEYGRQSQVHALLSEHGKKGVYMDLMVLFPFFVFFCFLAACLHKSSPGKAENLNVISRSWKSHPRLISAWIFLMFSFYLLLFPGV